MSLGELDHTRFYLIKKTISSYIEYPGFLFIRGSGVFVYPIFDTQNKKKEGRLKETEDQVSRGGRGPNCREHILRRSDSNLKGPVLMSKGYHPGPRPSQSRRFTIKRSR